MKLNPYVVEKIRPGFCFPMGQNGRKWTVLEVDLNAHTALIISSTVICMKPYEETGNDTTWAECSLRTWLNHEFFTSEFSRGEQEAILESNIHTPDNTVFGTKGGADTKDRIWLLSTEEAKRYCPDDRGVYGWWLRSPGNEQNYAMGVHLNPSGCYVIYESGVRPVFRINLDSPVIKLICVEAGNN